MRLNLFLRQHADYRLFCSTFYSYSMRKVEMLHGKIHFYFAFFGDSKNYHYLCTIILRK